MKICTAILAVMVAVWLVAPAVAVAQSAPPSVVPTLRCVRYDLDTKMLHVFLGYTSTHTVPVTIPVDSRNFFFPEPQNQNQPTVFLPGTHELVFYNSFVVDPSGKQQTSWLLDGSSVTANRDSTPCTFPFPLPAGPVGPSGPAGSAGPVGPPGSGLGQATLRKVTAAGFFTLSVTATCAAGETVMGGGGWCPGEELRTSAPTANGWTVTCHDPTTVTATAICARP